MAFSIAVTSPMKGAERISRSLGVYAGNVSITSYSQTLVECTAITKYFVPTSNATTGGFPKGIMSCQIDGPSSGGYIVRWDATTGAFRAYVPTNVVISGSATGAGLTVDLAIPAVQAVSTAGSIVATAAQAAANTLIGSFGFVAVGLVRA